SPRRNDVARVTCPLAVPRRLSANGEARISDRKSPAGRLYFLRVRCGHPRVCAGACARRRTGVSMKVLIADDRPIVRRALREVLESDPSMVVIGEATNGDEALELARTLEWDLAVFDFSMPGRSGLDLLDSIKREFPTRPVLVMSMHSEELHGERVLKAGAA